MMLWFAFSDLCIVFLNRCWMIRGWLWVRERESVRAREAARKRGREREREGEGDKKVAPPDREM